MKKWIIGVFSVLLFACSTMTSAIQNSDFSTAETLINNWFSAMKARDIEKAAGFLAPQFMSMHTDLISRDKAQEIELIKNLQMKDYHLSDFKFSRSGDIIVVTFVNAGSEKIDMESLSKEKAGRMAVLQKHGEKWLIVAYANLEPIKKAIELAAPR